MTHFRVTHSVLPILLSGKDMTKKRSSNSNTASAMDLFVLLLAAAASSLVLASPGIEAAPQYYYPPPYNYYENYDYNNHYYPLDRIAGAPREERLKPEEIMESAQEYAKMTRTMADFIDTKGPDFLSLLGSQNYQPGNGPFHLAPTIRKCGRKKGKLK